jgi:hypothetical protein
MIRLSIVKPFSALEHGTTVTWVLLIILGIKSIDARRTIELLNIQQKWTTPNLQIIDHFTCNYSVSGRSCSRKKIFKKEVPKMRSEAFLVHPPADAMQPGCWQTIENSHSSCSTGQLLNNFLTNVTRTCYYTESHQRCSNFSDCFELRGCY